MSDQIPVVHYNQGAAATSLDPKWWALEGKALAQSLFPLVEGIEKRQIYRKVQNLRFASLYSNYELLGLQAGMFNTTSQSYKTQTNGNRITLNVIKSCVDTATSKIAKAKPRPMFLSINGDWKIESRAKKLTQYLDGLFQEMGLYPQMQRSFSDSAIFGTGEVKFYIEDGKIKCERIIIDEIVIDDALAIYGTPLEKHQTRYVNRSTLLGMFPEFEYEIMSAQGGFRMDIQSQASQDLVRVVESWKLPSAPKAKDGKHAIVIQGATLFEKAYKKDFFPFVTQRWNEKITGYFGCGITEDIMGLQMELNKLLRIIQLAQHLMCVPRIWVENSSMVNIGNISNEAASIGKYTGQPPTAVTWPGMSPEVYQHAENIYRKAFEQVGISQLSASSQKPAGLNSGVAMRTYQDVESDRFQLTGQRYEQSHLEAARICIELTKDLAASGKDPFVKVRDGKSIKILKWSEVCLEEDAYEMRCFPTSMLPTTPEGKLQTVTELTQSGFIDKTMALSLLDFPDLESFMSMQTAALDDVKRILTDMIEEGKYTTPEPYMNLQLCLQLGQNSYLRAKINAVDEDRLELIRRFIDETKELITQATPPPQPAPMAPTAAPMKPEHSELMPLPAQGAPVQ